MTQQQFRDAQKQQHDIKRSFQQMTANKRYEALTAIRAVEERLSAWRDNAELMLKQAHNNISEERWQNERDNYASCLRDLDNAKQIVLGEC